MLKEAIEIVKSPVDSSEETHPVDQPHDTFHDKKGTLIMRTYKCFILLGSLFLAMSLLLTFAPPAFAANSGLARASVTTHVTMVPQDSASDPCNTAQRQENFAPLGFTLFWFKMQTSWCWDYRIVTRHTTVIYWGVTGWGAAVDWHFVAVTPIHFNCYIASGSTLQCSGNHEYAIATFRNGISGVECLLTINEWENYRGQFFSGASQACH